MGKDGAIIAVERRLYHTGIHINTIIAVTVDP